MDAIASLFRAAEPVAVGSLTEWLASETTSADAFERAVGGGARADRLGFAFVAGYHAALAALSARAPATRAAFPARLSLAVTESGGGHPRAIETTLVERADHVVVRGEKTFATLASVADEILVLASAGEREAGRKDLRLVRVPAAAARVQDRAPLPFAPEIPHARVRFEDVAVAREAVLPGEAFTTYVKPFRTLEDVHVLAATVAHLVQLLRFDARAPEALDEAASLLVALERLAQSDPESPEVHLALAGTFDRAEVVARTVASAGKTERLERLVRDLPLLLVAASARAKRREAAARVLGLADVSSER